jgi:hypothetical protein
MIKKTCPQYKAFNYSLTLFGRSLIIIEKVLNSLNEKNLVNA